METPHRVFLIPELVEEILQRLDMRTLLISQRVCCKWRDIIQTRAEFQEALFFKPRSLHHSHTNEQTRNPLLSELFWLDKKQKPSHRSRLWKRLRSISSDTNQKPVPWLRPEASWRKMLLQQPPTCNLGLLELDESRSRYTRLRVISRPGLPDLRMEIFSSAIHDGTLVSGRQGFMLWGPRFSPRVLALPGVINCWTRCMEWKYTHITRVATERHFENCDMFIIAKSQFDLRLHSSPVTSSGNVEYMPVPSQLERWFHKTFGIEEVCDVAA